MSDYKSRKMPPSRFDDSKRHPDIALFKSAVDEARDEGMTVMSDKAAFGNLSTAEMERLRHSAAAESGRVASVEEASKRTSEST